MLRKIRLASASVVAKSQLLLLCSVKNVLRTPVPVPAEVQPATCQVTVQFRPALERLKALPLRIPEVFEPVPSTTLACDPLSLTDPVPAFTPLSKKPKPPPIAGLVARTPLLKSSSSRVSAKTELTPPRTIPATNRLE
jgi:hypothetical protein